MTTASEDAEPAGFPVTVLPRQVSVLRRMLEGTAVLTRSASHAEVLYATGMYSRSAIASALSGTPLVIKLVNDPAFERARSRHLFSGSLEEFQQHRGSLPVRALRLARQLALTRASRVIVPSQYLAGLVAQWEIPAEHIRIVPNAMPPIVCREPRHTIRARLGLHGAAFVFAGRFVEQKNLDSAIAAVARVPEATLVLVGEGPELPRLRKQVQTARVVDRVRFVGPRPRAQVMDWLRAADAALMSSAWENLPHAAIEALSVGTPVIATSVGGLPEIVEVGVNGLLARPGDVHGLASAIERFVVDEELRLRLRAGAMQSAARFAPEPTFERIERVLDEVASD